MISILDFSSFSTTLNSLSGVIYKDFVCKATKKSFSESQALIIVKSIVFITGILCILLSFVVEHLGGLFYVASNILSLVNGPQLGMFSLGILIPKANSNVCNHLKIDKHSCLFVKQGAFYGGIVSFISATSITLSAMYYKSKKMLPTFVKPMSTAGCGFNHTKFDDIVVDWTIA